MKVVIQRVTSASVTVDGMITGKIGRGILVLAGVGHNDNEDTVRWCCDKIVNLRIFEDENGKMNYSLLDKNLSLLVVSQFTLYGQVKKGRRPDFTEAAPSVKANRLYEFMKEYLKSKGIKVESGIFGAMMNVELVNDGPVTLIIEKKGHN